VLNNEEISAKLRDIDSVLIDIQARTTPWGLSEHVEQLELMIDNRQIDINEIKRTVAHIKEKMVEDVSDEELIHLWKKSGVKLKQIADHFKFEESTASRLVNGKVADLKTRHSLKLFFLEYIK